MSCAYDLGLHSIGASLHLRYTHFGRPYSTTHSLSTSAHPALLTRLSVASHRHVPLAPAELSAWHIDTSRSVSLGMRSMRSVYIHRTNNY